MKKFQGIIESPTPPPINCFWLYNGTVRYFNNKTGKWGLVNSSESNSDILKIAISEEDLNKVLNGEQVIIKNNKISPYANVSCWFNYKLVCSQKSKFMKFQKDYLN